MSIENTEEVSNFGARLKAARKLHGQNQDVFASRIGVARDTLSRYERGEISPSTETFKAIALELHELVTTDWLLYGDLEDLDQPEPIVLRNFGTLVGLSFKKQGAAIMSVSYGEISRIMNSCLEYEKTKQSPKKEIFKHFKILSEHFMNQQINDDSTPHIVIETVIAQLGVKLTPLFPEDHLMKLIRDGKIKQDSDIKETIND